MSQWVKITYSEQKISVDCVLFDDNFVPSRTLLYCLLGRVVIRKSSKYGKFVTQSYRNTADCFVLGTYKLFQSLEELGCARPIISLIDA